ncbi:MAG: hypothetical protein AAGB22_16090, partial [Bacteroidota bacterium]
MDRPECVNRVMPPTTTIDSTSKQPEKSQMISERFGEFFRNSNVLSMPKSKVCNHPVYPGSKTKKERPCLAALTILLLYRQLPAGIKFQQGIKDVWERNVGGFGSFHLTLVSIARL